jgi:hypothetical protein
MGCVLGVEKWGPVEPRGGDCVAQVEGVWSMLAGCVPGIEKWGPGEPRGGDCIAQVEGGVVYVIWLCARC